MRTSFELGALGFVAVTFLTAGCDGGAASSDVGTSDAGTDSSRIDAGADSSVDARPVDATLDSSVDVGLDVTGDSLFDAGALDSGLDASADAGLQEAGPQEAGPQEAGIQDVGTDVSPDGGALPGLLLINEVDYDQPGTDNAEFVELLNTGGAMSLDGIAVLLINGSTDSAYCMVQLSGNLNAGQYLVIGIAGQTFSVPSGAMRVDFQSGCPSIQNDTEGVLVYRPSNGMMIDGFSYEGAINAAMVSGMTYNLVQGPAVNLIDSGAVSIARRPGGQNTGSHSADWQVVSSPTAGSANPA